MKFKYIPHIYDTGKATVKDVQNNTDEKLYYVTDYYQNKTLLEYVLSTEKGFSEIHTKFIFSKILKGVKYCHDAGICHLDLHLKNILLNENFEPKIIDFGLSLQMKFSDKLGFFKRESYTGKERCPEHFGKKLFDGKAVDIFCLGIILLHLRTCLFGFHPDLSIKHNLYNLIKEKKYDIFWIILTKKFPYISKLSPEFKKLYTSMVAYDPIERPDIDEILKGPWMKEINDLNEEEYSKLEEEVLDMFSKLKESIDNKNKDTFNVNENKDKSNIKGSLNGNKGLKEITKFDKVFFNGSLAPKYIYHKGYNAEELRRIFTGRKIPEIFDRDEISKLLLRILGIAEDGLEQRGFGEETYLEPLYPRAEKLMSPAAEMLIGLKNGKATEEYISEYGRL